jgi:hypothetical protein
LLAATLTTATTPGLTSTPASPTTPGRATQEIVTPNSPSSPVTPYTSSIKRVKELNEEALVSNQPHHGPQHATVYSPGAAKDEVQQFFDGEQPMDIEHDDSADEIVVPTTGIGNDTPGRRGGLNKHLNLSPARPSTDTDHGTTLLPAIKMEKSPKGKKSKKNKKPEKIGNLKRKCYNEDRCKQTYTVFHSSITSFQAHYA